MSYCSLDDITPKRIPEAELIELTDDAGAGVVDTEIAQGILDSATALVDSYIRGRCPVPLDPIPPVGKQLCEDISTYLFYARRGLARETVTKGKDDAIALLKDIAKGVAHLPQADGEQPAEEGGPQASKTVDDRVFSDDKLSNF